MVTGTPYTRGLEGLLELAAENEVIDEDAKTIMEGALTVGEMQARDVMILALKWSSFALAQHLRK